MFQASTVEGKFLTVAAGNSFRCIEISRRTFIIESQKFLTISEGLLVEKINREIELRESYAEIFVDAFREEILNLTGEAAEMKLDFYENRPLKVDGIAIVIGLTGSPSGRAVVYMSDETLKIFARKMLRQDEFSEDEANDAAEDAANVFVARGAKLLNELAKKNLTLTPPGTICGSAIKIAAHKLITFKITAALSFGEICMNIGFAEGD